MDAAAAEARFGTMTAGYESYYLRAAAPAGGEGFWLRHTVRVAPGESPTGSLWLTWFDADEGPTATKLTVPGPEAADGPGQPWLEIAAATIGEGRAVGAVAPSEGRLAAQWELSFDGAPRLDHLPSPWMYRASLPRTKPISLHPVARVAGAVSIDGRHHHIDEWPGMVGHNWGTQHAERWIWLHGLSFEGQDDDTWLDVVLGRVRVGPVVLPWVASGALCLRGERIPVGGLGRVGATKVAERPTGARLTRPGAHGLAVHVEVGAPQSRFVGWTYADPDGGTHEVANCSIADLEATVHRPSRPVANLRARGTAAYELGMREADHGIPIQPYPDGPLTS